MLMKPHTSSLKFPKVASVLPVIAGALGWWRQKGSDYNSKSWDKALASLSGPLTENI